MGRIMERRASVEQEAEIDRLMALHIADGVEIENERARSWAMAARAESIEREYREYPEETT